jgi:hypothetical protein
MKKLTLNLDDLSVETFATAPAGEQGAVVGYGPNTRICSPTGDLTGCKTKALTCAGTCLWEWTCNRICLDK